MTIMCKCGGRMEITDSRTKDNTMYRRRRCRSCRAVENTIEVPCDAIPPSSQHVFKAKPPKNAAFNPAFSGKRKPKPESNITLSPRSPMTPKPKEPVEEVEPTPRSRLEDVQMQREIKAAGGRGWE